jgi:cytochrome b involved in lipid metabolism
MTNKELQKAIKDATDEIRNLSSSPASGPFPQHEVTRREMILLRQLTLLKIEDAKKCKRKDLECFNTEIYDLMTAFVKSQ